MLLVGPLLSLYSVRIIYQIYIKCRMIPVWYLIRHYAYIDVVPHIYLVHGYVDIRTVHMAEAYRTVLDLVRIIWGEEKLCTKKKSYI